MATNQSRNINFYSTIRPVTELVSRTPFHTITLADPVKSLTWKTGSGSRLGSGATGGQTQALNLETVVNCSNTSTSNNKRNNIEMNSKDADFLRSNRLLVATTTGFADMDVIESVGLAQGARGCVAVGAGKDMDIVNTNSWGLSTWSDMETLMGTRCTAGYSIDAGKNLQVLSEEMDALMASGIRELRPQALTSPATVLTEIGIGSLDSLSIAPAAADKISVQPESSESTSQKDSVDSAFFVPTSSSSFIPSDTRRLLRQVQLFGLTRLWAWVDRVESLSNENMSVSSCGVINLLTSSTQSTACSMHAELGVMVYFSVNRNLAKELCGWTRMELDRTVELQQPGLHVTTLPITKAKVLERTKSRTTSSDYSHDSLVIGGNKSQGSVDDEGDDSASDKGQKGGSLRGSRRRSGRNSLSSSSVGFDPLSELEEMVAECEETDCFERAAAVALFHGNLTLAVTILQKHIPVSDGNRKSVGSSGAALGYDRSGDSPLPSNQVKGTKENPSIADIAGNSGDALTVANVDVANVTEGEEASNVITSNSTVALQSSNALRSDAQYSQLISLTAMCIAGFCNNSSVKSSVSIALSPQQEMWASMCRHVVAQLELQAEIENDHRISSCCYLAAALRFLLNSLSDISADQIKSSVSTSHSKSTLKRSTETVVAGVKYGCVINDDRLSLQDRVAFALTFLDDHQNLEWLQGIKDDCTVRGDLAGLVVTGLSREGLDLLQQYLDRHDDLQTVALLVGRNVIDNAAVNTAASVGSGSTVDGGPLSSQVKSREWQWLWEYRNLLNKMQLFIGRASLDVQLGRRNRLIVRPGPTAAVGDVTSSSARSGSSGNIPYGQGKLRQSQPPGAAGRGSGSAIDRKSGSARVLYQLPPHSDLPHVFLRCNYCSSSLPVDPMQQQQAAFFRKQRPLINCCANCKKPLPRCYVCLLYMGLVNPTHGRPCYNRFIMFSTMNGHHRYY